MSKSTIGMIAAGATLATAAALAVFAGGDDGGHTGTTGSVRIAGATISPSGTAGSAGPASSASGAAAARGVAAAQESSRSAQAGTKAQPKTAAKASRAVRSVVLRLPADATKAGSNVNGLIQVLDTTGAAVSPGAGAEVALQQKRDKQFVTVYSGTTNDNGQFAVSFTNRSNATWRAELTLASGATLHSASVNTQASASVSWAARPEMDVVHGAATSYSFRVSSDTTGPAHLEIANTKTPTKWVAVSGVSVPATGVVTQSVSFPKAGTWLLRGVKSKNATNGVGYTTELNISVS
jgi:hypothetical protein